MSEHAQAFICHLSALAEKDRGALSALRRSLGFAPGALPAAYPYVEPFVGAEKHAEDPYRLALYLTAGLFALHPQQRDNTSFAAAFGTLSRLRESASLEKRFIALLSAEPESLPTLLRQVIALLASEQLPFDYAQLLTDLSYWLSPFAHGARDRLRQQWARDYYRHLAPAPDHSNATATTETD